MKKKKKEEKKEVTKVKKSKEKKKPKKPENLGTLGVNKLKIHELGKKVVNGIEYNDIHLENGQTMLLSDRDLKLQRGK